MPAWAVTIIVALVPALLGWIFSGSTSTNVKRSVGLQDLDREGVSGTSDIKLPEV